MVIHGIFECDIGIDQLSHILVPGRNDDLEVLSGGLCGKGSNNIISFNPGMHNQGDTQCLNDVMERGDL